MRRLRYNVAMSVDGFIAGPQGEFDWITMDPTIDFSSLFSEFDTLLMGRKTFQGLRNQGPGGPTSGMKVIVISTTLRPVDYPDVTIINQDVSLAVASLKRLTGKDIWLFGGGTLFRSLLDARLVDAIELAVMPVLLGQGIPLLPSGQRSPTLHLTGSKTLPSGIVMLAYSLKDHPG
ncbi:MAG: dihydrofolate reductase [Proteobacteria bacterium]|nr:dihydrofolate reductase [Pseudomonadota bacterium]